MGQTVSTKDTETIAMENFHSTYLFSCRYRNLIVFPKFSNASSLTTEILFNLKSNSRSLCIPLSDSVGISLMLLFPNLSHSKRSKYPREYKLDLSILKEENI